MTASEPINGLSFDSSTGCIHYLGGEETVLRPQTARVFALLLENRDRIVSRDELLAKVWPDTQVTDESVTQCIREIRKSLGQHGHELLSTFPRRGYKLSLPAEPKNQAELTLGQNKILLLAGLALICVVLIYLTFSKEDVIDEQAKIPPSVTVVPFQSVEGSEKWVRLASGLSGEIAASLARNRWLQVTVLPQGNESAIDQGYILSGTVSTDHEKIRLSARLVNANTGTILWSELWQGTIDSVFDLQTRLLEKAEASIAARWSGVISKDRMNALRQNTRSLTAFDFYLRAIEHKHRFTPEALQLAQLDLESALELDPAYGRAWVALSVVYLLQMEHAKDRNTFLQHYHARIEAVKKANQLIPDDPEVLVQSTFLYGIENRHELAESALRKAVELAPNNPDILAQAAWGGSRRVPVGGDAVSWSERALQLHPDPPSWYYAGLGTAAFYAEDYTKAVYAYASAPPTTEVLYRWAAAEFSLGEEDNAEKLLLRAKKRLPKGVTIEELEASDGNTYPPYAERLNNILKKISLANE